jgi:sugar phosphate permease
MIKSHTNIDKNAPTNIGWLVTITVILFYAYEYFLRVEPSPMIDYFIAHYSVNLAGIGTIDAAYYWTYIPMQILVGTIVDQFGVRKPLFLAVISCVIGSVFFGVENNFTSVIIGRMLIGFGSAFGFVAVLKTATVWLPKRHFTLAVGAATSLGMLGAILSLTTITYLIQNLGVKTTIDVSVISGLILLIIIYFIVHDRIKLNRSHHFSKRIKNIRKAFFSVIRNPQIWLVGFIGLALYLPTLLFGGLWGIPYFIHIKHYSPETASFLSSLLFWGWIIGAPITGYIAEYMINDNRLLLMISSTVCTVLLTLMIYGGIGDLYTYAALIFFLGIFSSFQIVVFKVATALCPRSCSGTAVAVVNMFVMFGGPLQRWIGSLIESQKEGAAVFTEAGFQQAFLIMPVLCLLAFFVTFFLKDSKNHK